MLSGCRTVMPKGCMELPLAGQFGVQGLGFRRRVYGSRGCETGNLAVFVSVNVLVASDGARCS